MTPLEIVTVMNREDGKAVEAVEEVLPQIAQAIAWCTDSLKQKENHLYGSRYQRKAGGTGCGGMSAHLRGVAGCGGGLMAGGLRCLL